MFDVTERCLHLQSVPWLNQPAESHPTYDVLRAYKVCVIREMPDER